MPATRRIISTPQRKPKRTVDELMAEPANQTTTPPEIERLRRDMIAAIDETLALVNPQWTIRELRLAVNADGRVESSPLLRRRPRRHAPTADHKININPSGSSA